MPEAGPLAGPGDPQCTRFICAFEIVLSNKSIYTLRHHNLGLFAESGTVQSLARSIVPETTNRTQTQHGPTFLLIQNKGEPRQARTNRPRSDTSTHRRMQHSESVQSTWPALDESTIPRLLPPTAARGHNRSRTAIDIPPLLPRRDSQSPSRSSTYLPFLSSSRSASPKQASPAEFTQTVADEVTRPGHNRSKSKVGNLASWFDGSSDPVNIGLVAASQEGQQEIGIMNTTFTGSKESLSTHAQRPVMLSANNSTSRFSFFSKKSSTTQLKSDADILSDINISEALFPDGPVDEISPAAFKNLQQTAESTLRKFQTAYRDQGVILRRTSSEKNVQADELEASTTRNEHLKAQLLEMAERAAQQEKLIASLQAENEQMKANEIALRSIRVITDHTSTDPLVLETRRNRSSDVSLVDSVGSASTDMSTDESIFSNDEDLNERSPGTSIGCPSPTLKHTCRVVSPHIKASQVEHLRSLTTNIENAGTSTRGQHCPNCHGVRQHEAWTVLGMIKAENAGLKERIQELQQSQDNVMDLLEWRPVELHDLNTKVKRVMSGTYDHEDMKGTIC